MINRYFYKSSISDFLDTPVDTIFGQMSRADEMDSAATQKYAWELVLFGMAICVIMAILGITMNLTVVINGIE